MNGPFEMREAQDGLVQFCFSHISKEFTTGVLLLQPDTELPKHNRPQAEENLLQVSGVSQVTLFMENGDVEASYELRPGMSLKIKKGQWYVHANPFAEPSVTMFKAEGDILDSIHALRHKYDAIAIEPAQKP